MLISKPVTAARARNLTTILRPFVLWHVESIGVPYWTGDVRGWFRPIRDSVSRFGHIPRARALTNRRRTREPPLRYCALGGRGRTALRLTCLSNHVMQDGMRSPAPVLMVGRIPGPPSSNRRAHPDRQR